MLGQAVLVWLLIAAVEVVQGIFRVRLLNQRVGDRRARQNGVATGSVFILAIAWAADPWIGARATRDCLAVGGLWLVLMLALDLVVGRWVFHLPWSRIARDFDVRRGGLLGLGMLVLFCTPLIARLVRANG